MCMMTLRIKNLEVEAYDAFLFIRIYKYLLHQVVLHQVVRIQSSFQNGPRFPVVSDSIRRRRCDCNFHRRSTACWRWRISVLVDVFHPVWVPARSSLAESRLPRGGRGISARRGREGGIPVRSAAARLLRSREEGGSRSKNDQGCDWRYSSRHLNLYLSMSCSRTRSFSLILILFLFVFDFVDSSRK